MAACRLLCRNKEKIMGNFEKDGSCGCGSKEKTNKKPDFVKKGEQKAKEDLIKNPEEQMVG